VPEAAMNCFQLIRSVLDEAYNAIPGKKAAKDAAIEEALGGLSKAYKNLLKKGCLDYSDPARRFAYIYRYTTSHANIVYNKLSDHKSLRELFKQERLVVSCIGGGPGSDFLGILKYCLKNKKTVELKCQIMDRDPAWSESWSDVDDKVKSTFRLSTSYQPIDVADAASWGKFCKHFQADLFTLIYFVSEVYAVAAKANDYFATLLAQMKPGATLLYVDNNDSRFTEWFDRLVKKAKLTVLKDGAGVEKMPWDEDKSDLEPYFSKFGAPKLNADIAYRVIRKPA
jgi:hypothetical protein